LLLESLAVDPLHRDLAAAGKLVDLAGSRIVTPLGHSHGSHTVRMLLEHHPDSVQAVDGLRALLRAWPLRPVGIAAAHGSGASSRSTSPSMGLTDVTMTLAWDPVRRRRPVRLPRQPWPCSSIS